MDNKRYKRFQDYLPQLQERFPEFSNEDLTKIIRWGSREMYQIIVSNGDLLFMNNLKDFKFKLLIGRVLFPSIAHKIRYILSKASIRFRRIYKQTKEVWDGYYYFGLTDAAFERYESQMSSYYKDPVKRRNKYKNSEFNYGEVMLYRILDECKLNTAYTHFFRVPFLSIRGFKVYEEEFITKKAEYIIKRSIDGFENV